MKIAKALKNCGTFFISTEKKIVALIRERTLIGDTVPIIVIVHALTELRGQ